MTRGTTPKVYGDYDITVIRSGDLNGRWLNKDSLLKTKNNKEIFFLNKNDVLISSIGFGSIGKIDIFYSEENYSTVSEVTVLRKLKVNPFYLSEYLKTKFGQAFIEKGITGATGQLHLNKGSIKELPIPIFSIQLENEIEEIVKRSYHLIYSSKSKYAEAEATLLDEVDLRNWRPTETSIEIKTFKRSFYKLHA
ncbi:MAG: restriction endonuclease subunit S [Segetibacter sp.]